MKDLVSIVLPTYNGQRYLASSIESILNQDYPYFEIILVNDGSTDETQRIISELLFRDNRIRCINNNENVGLPESLNRGFQKATGIWHTWTSDDNLMKKNHLTELISAASTHNADFVYSDYECIDPRGESIGVRRVKNPEHIIGSNIVGASFLYKAYIFNFIGKYDPNKIMYEDYDYWTRIFKAGIEMKPIHGSPTYSYRLHTSQLSATRRMPKAAFESRFDLIAAANITNKLRSQYCYILFSEALYSRKYKIATQSIGQALRLAPFPTLLELFRNIKKKVVNFVIYN